MSRATKRDHERQRRPLLWQVGLAIGLAVTAAAVFLLFGRGGQTSISVEQGTPGRLVASQATADLGRVPFDKMVEARFELANTGASTVRLVGPPKVRMLEGC